MELNVREEPTGRIPLGIIALFVGLMIYGIVLARYLPGLIGSWPTLIQTLVYVFFGVVWLLPLRNFLIWMETGNWGEKKD